MAVAQFRELFLRLCEEYHVEPEEALLEELRSATIEDRGGQCLQLGRVNLAPRIAAVLGQCLAVDTVCFSEISLEDCALADDAVRALAHALATNTACVSLDMKGNNIRGVAVEALGRMLKENSTLKSLCLEWNGLGLVENSFAVFCDGLASNKCLEALDLRNNQLTHESAIHLARALRSNNTLLRLDLRWNTFGLLGGRQLLAAFDDNRAVSRVDLTGNDMPADVARAIDLATARNAERRDLELSHMSRSNLLGSAIEELKREKSNQMLDLMQRFDSQEEELHRNAQASAMMLRDLQSKLDERRATIANLNGRIAMLESQVELAGGKLSDQQAALERAAEDRKAFEAERANELSREREARFSLEQRLSRELKELASHTADVETRLAETERRLKLANEAQLAAREELAQAQLNARTRVAQLDERLQSERQKAKEHEHEAEVAKEKELSALRAEFEQSEQLYKEKVRKLEAERASTEQELTRVRNQALQDRLVLEDQMTAVRQRMKAEEEQRTMQLEDRLRNVQLAKDELSAQHMQQTNALSETQSRAHQLALELETLKRRIDDLIQQLANKSQETVAEVAKVKLEAQHKIARLEQEHLAIQELYDRISALEREIEAEKSRGRQRAAELEAELRNALGRAEFREREIAAWRDSEQKRSVFLQQAFLQYMGSSPAPAYTLPAPSLESASAFGGLAASAAAASFEPSGQHYPHGAPSPRASSLPPIKSK